MSPEDHAQPTPDSAPERSAEAPSEPVTSDVGAADLESPTSWAAPAAEGSAPDAGTTEVDEPATYEADPYEPSTYEAESYEAAAYDTESYEAGPGPEEGPEEGYEAEEPDAVAV
ncbi:MAG TPA: hypothetical protein VG455_11880, partial [Acidimicrobiales bacterium]|nr:hypothetical protein [Acidimicrobiales bacterium]